MGSIVLSAEYTDTVSHMASHFHDCHQLIYLTKGSALVTIRNQHYRAAAGTLLLISRFEEHAIQADSPEYCRFTLRISPDLADWNVLPGDALLSLLVNRPKNFQHALFLGDLPDIESLFQKIVMEKKTGGPFSEKMMELLVLQLLVTACRTCPELVSDEERNLQLIRQIQQQMERNCQAKYTLQSLARQYHMSPSHLSHLFRRVTGISVMGYLSACRFAAAKRYLAETDLEIGRIVELCGFSDNSNFSRSFKTATGTSPTAFRKQFRYPK